MKITYFPFTFIRPPVARRVADLLGPPIIYQACTRFIPPELRALGDDGDIEIRVPDDSRTDRLVGMLEDFKSWVRLHPGDGLTFLKARQGPRPYYDSDIPSRIRDRIRRASASGAPDLPDEETAPVDSLFEARLFLCAAQEYDRHQGTIQDDLESVRQMERRMLEGIHGDPTLAPSLEPAAPLPPADPGARLAIARLQAWCRVHRADPDPIGSVYLTDSPAVFETLLEQTPSAVRLISIDPAGADQPSQHGSIPAFIDALQQADPRRLQAGDLPPAPLPAEARSGLHLALLSPGVLPVCGPADAEGVAGDREPVKRNPILALWDA